jgi:hypothetical protein
VIEAGGGGDLQEPAGGVRAGLPIASLDRAGDRLLAQIIRVAGAAGHAVAHHPEALT